jgi:hypothetical protein
MYSVYTTNGDKPAFHQMGTVVVVPGIKWPKKTTYLHIMPWLIMYGGTPPLLYMRNVRKVSSQFEYLENQSRGLDVTW